MENQTKICIHCGQAKAFNEFHKDKRNALGISSWCNECQKKLRSEYYKKNRDKRKQQTRDRYWKDPEKAKQWWRDYYQANKEKIKADAKKYKEAHREQYQNIIKTE